MIYTSYFGNLSKLPAEAIKLSVARSQPNSTGFKTLDFLKPTFKLLNAYKLRQVSDEEYTEIYRRQLDSVSPEVWSVFVTFLQNAQVDVVLLCWEKSGSFCHRHIISEYLKTRFSIVINEF